MPGTAFTILVNNKPVSFDDHRVTGAQVKKAAIDAGIEIDADFQLSVIKPNGELEVIGDDDPVTINKNSKFRAVAPDDNS